MATDSKPPYFAEDWDFDGLPADDRAAMIEHLSLKGGGEPKSPGERLKSVREVRGLSLRSLASLVGEDTHFTTIAKLETGKMKMSLEWAERLAPALQVMPTFLLGRFDAPQSARVVPKYTYEDLALENGAVKFGEASGTGVTTVGGPNSFAIPVLILREPREVDATVIVDPDLRGLRENQTYALFNRSDTLMLSYFKHDPARFVPWIGEDDRDIMLGEEVAHVIGTVVFVSFYP